MRHTVRGIATILMIAVAARAVGQGSGGGRGTGTAGRGGRGTAAATPEWSADGKWITFGSGGTTLDCAQCSVHIGAGAPWVEFGAEPVVRSTTVAGGSLRVGDVLVAIDGTLITTPAGGQRLASLPAGKPVQFSVRREGRLMDIAITPTSVSGNTAGAAPGGFLGLTEPLAWRGTPLHFTMKSDSGKRFIILPHRDSVTIVRRDSSGHLAWQFSDKPTFVATLPDGRPIGAVHTIPDPFYITSMTDSSVTRKSVRFLNVPSNGVVRIYTSDGVLVRVLQNTAKESGAAVAWDGRNRTNQFVGSGIYFYTVEASGVPTSSGRLTIVNATGTRSTYWTTKGDSGTGYKFGRGARIEVDSVAAGRLHGTIDFSPDAAYQATAQEYLLLGSHTAKGWLGFGIECHDCSFAVDSTRTSIWRFPTYPTIAAVDRSGPAESAGMLAGDLLRAIDGTLLTTPAGATRFSMLKAGDRVRMTVEREGKAIELTVVVGKVN